ncbi:MAG: hypothetical protein CM1200mP2_55950 [Planctomycetaceae bacterium]|nr:MAG: hypothetical protein CM1200mP2_55950 [Planctomycetaceae bacterium]
MMASSNPVPTCESHMPDNLFDVSEKVVIVTGASRGIGRAVAEGFLAHGARVVLSARSEASSNRSAVTTPIGPSRCEPTCPTPIRDSRSPVPRSNLRPHRRVVKMRHHPAGAPPYETPPGKPPRRNSAVRSAWRGRRRCDGRDRRGSIVHVASIAGIVAMPGNPSYSAAKAGLRHLSKAMANDYAERNIRINTICPGYFLTDMTRASYDDPQRQAERSSHTMMGRWGRPEELLGPCLFPGQRRSSYVTGIDLIVDGGWTGKGM